MNKYIVLILVFMLSLTQNVEAGNPDRQGQAGAYELLLNPWARSAGLKGLVTGTVKGIESLRVNPAGLTFMGQTQVVLARTYYLQGTGVSLNGLGLGQRISDKGVLGISLMSVDFGEIDVTTTDFPEGIGATYRPLFFNLGLGYAHQFSERITTGFTLRLISESAQNVSAIGAAIDAGIQYHTNDFHFGISLRNIGAPMKFSGDGTVFTGNSPVTQLDPVNGNDTYSVAIRENPFELPSQLNIGIGYDWKLSEDLHRVSFMGNFTSNSFSKDQFGLGVEYALREMFMLRVGYQYENGMFDSETRTNAHTGLGAGVSVEMPLKKGGDSKLGIDYSYQTTSPFNGTHTIGLRFNL